MSRKYTTEENNYNENEDFTLETFVKENYSEEELLNNPQVKNFLEGEFLENYRKNVSSSIEYLLGNLLYDLDMDNSALLGAQNIDDSINGIEDIVIAYTVRDNDLNKLFEDEDTLKYLVESDMTFMNTDKIMKPKKEKMLIQKKTFDWATKTYKNNS